MSRAMVVMLVLCAGLLGCSGEDPGQGGAANPAAVTVADSTLKVVPDPDAGRETFEFWCAPCHAPGLEHPGTRRLGERLGPELAVLLERPGLEAAYVQTVVRNGFQMMPPFRETEISDAHLSALAAYVADASRKAGENGGVP